MRLITYRDRDHNIRPGVLLGEEIVDISDHVTSVRRLIELGPDALGPLGTFLQRKTGRIPLARVELLAPLQDPPRIFCVGLAYRDHAIETHQEIPKVPTIFLKLTSASTDRAQRLSCRSSLSSPITKRNSPSLSERAARTFPLIPGRSTSLATRS
jgi:2-keto-4-pentenoate hydratase/2-oxohepta-3-ene-1,7-dioic acid hydratase in catechol pathway